MTIKNISAAETWEKVYSAFQQVNFVSYDFDTVKESLIQYIQIYHPEDFNDWIESGELVTIIETFAYTAELLAYRTDMLSHENFITTAQRKQAVLRLAKLINYSASRNIPARGLVKLTSIKTTETIFDSLGNNLANVTINWNDPNNTNWKEQFLLVVGASLTTKFGQPSKSFQVADVLMQSYTFNNAAGAFRNGVYTFTASGTTDSLPMEITPIDIDTNGPFEKAPDANAQMTVAYATDGRGDGSDYTGFLMFIKQGTLVKTDYSIVEPIPNRRLILNQLNVNDTDVWVYSVDDNGSIIERWSEVEAMADQSLAFNLIDSRKKFEVETLENDQIALKFGDGNFSDIPLGTFQIWARSSVNQSVTVPKNRIANQSMSFSYQNAQNVKQTVTMTFSLTSALQNNSPSETIEHIRQASPSVYYSQNRMVNGQDHNTYMLRDPTILKLNAINRTFAGQPKYIEWNDASGMYQNVKLFGDDLNITLDIGVDLNQTTNTARSLIDNIIEPQLASTGVVNALVHVFSSYTLNISTSDNSGAPTTTTGTYGVISYPRKRFIEDNRSIYYSIRTVAGSDEPIDLYSGIPSGIEGRLLEKTMIQGALDGHYYGEPLSTVLINGVLHGVVPDPALPENESLTDKLYADTMPRTIDGVFTYPPGDVGSGLQGTTQGKFGLKFNRYFRQIGGAADGLTLSAVSTGTDTGLIVDPDDTSFPFTTTSAALNPLRSTKYRTVADVNEHSKLETFTIEMTSDGNTFTVISNLRGKLPSFSLILAASGNDWEAQHPSETLPFNFNIDYDSGTDTPYEPGDAYVVDMAYYDATNANTVFGGSPGAGWYLSERKFGYYRERINLTGYWSLVPDTASIFVSNLEGPNLFVGGEDDGPGELDKHAFNPADATGWIFLVSKHLDDFGDTSSWNIYNRDFKIIVHSPTTKFWFNQESNIVDFETQKPLHDKIRILRSNHDFLGQPLKYAEIYDCVDFVYDDNGEVITSELEVMPAGIVDFNPLEDLTPENLLQFEAFSAGTFVYRLATGTLPPVPPAPQEISWVLGTVIDNDTFDGADSISPGFIDDPYNPDKYPAMTVVYNGLTFIFDSGSFMADADGESPVLHRLVRIPSVPAPVQVNPITDTIADEDEEVEGLDFMWQHYTPNTNLIDPSVSNIHDIFLLTSGYYTSVQNYIAGLTTVVPTLPTPLDLRTSYGYLLENKMLSDSVILHPGRIKLLFGSYADQTLRAKFKVVMSPNATFSQERVKQEVVNVIDTYFDIANWDFGDTFYATELLSLIHQALPTQIASVVLVPTYSTSSLGSMFTVNSGIDEILQSAATVNDIEIVSALTPSALRQFT